MKISKQTLIFIGILSISMSLALIVAGFYVHISSGEDLTLDTTDRTSDMLSAFDDITSKEATTIFADTSEITTEVLQTTEIIEDTTGAPVTAESETRVEETTIEETTDVQTTAEVTTAEETTSAETTVEETTNEETTIEETTLEETTNEETTIEETTVEETTTAPETTVHIHAFSSWKTITPPTCEKEGMRSRECSCGEKQERPIEAPGHTVKKLEAVAATCQKTGLTAGEKCTVCNKTLKKQTVIAKIDCKYENTVCIYCGKSESAEIVLTNNFAGLYKADTLECLYSLNADTKIAPASLTKMVTACVAIENMPLNTVITVGSELSLVPKYSSLCYIYKNQRVKLSDLLTGMLLCSGNDAAYTIAANVGRHTSGDSTLSDKEAITYFCKLMNEYVKKIGAVNSNFTTPDGSDSEGQYSTVNDLAIITSHAMKNKTVAEITSTHYKKVVFVSGQVAKWTNTNELIHPDSQYYTECASGFKTGGTELAGKCLSATFSKNGIEYIAIVMGCEDNDARYENILELINSIK
jgi:D-alanyl-D-alanine carboxypeptidase (penicillin-binding protein 5/6)